ncbi:hypothetical protein T11_17508 [Trichinella zimbabwensis]|uniref:Uncharacterized protein n=1 Tax=Trichinella zimbabwensis TaxID=268475 RepID=A0A0V1H216_9BILA|nr:hypothetical protein T11_17508 [Trichinella zimbabwensis]
MATGVHTASVQTWPATTTATHIGDRQNLLSARRIPPKFSWLLGPSSQRPLTYMSTMFQDTDYPA